ncbi:unnamed protein product, partial [Darwinula stevensoni]
MGKQPLIKQDGVITEALSNAMFRVRLENGHEVISTISGKMRMHYIRILPGIDLPKNKRGEIGLTYIYGIGRSTATGILESAGIDVNKKVKDWNDEEQTAIRNIITAEFKV